MIYLILIFEFLIIGTFSVGGGLATLPFLYNLAERYPWFDKATLIDMIAISESTPGPIGINMATYAGFKAGGILGGFLASVAVMATGVMFMLVVANILTKFKNHPLITKIFYGIRPTIAALIAYAAYEMVSVTLFKLEPFRIEWVSLGLFVIVLGILFKTKITPILLILGAAILGLLLPIA